MPGVRGLMSWFTRRWRSLSMLILMRSWGTSVVGSALSAMAYAFGGPILFQYTNIIYLVGAAWLPLGLHAVDRWVRLGRRWGLVELAIVLSMQVLGGEPQAAYLLGVASIGYAAGLAWSRAKIERQKTLPAPDRGAAARICHAWLAIVALILWFAGTLVLARWLPKLRDPGNPSAPFRWMPWEPSVVMVAWAVVAIGFLRHWRLRVWRHPLGVMWLGLAGAAIVVGRTDRRPALAGHRVHPADRPLPREHGRGLRDQRPASAAVRTGLAQHSGHAISNE